MYDLSTADVKGYMVDSSAMAVEHKVTCLQAVKGHRYTAASLRCRRSGKSNTKIGKY